jgi:phosphoglycerate dehydrogenase-like enzyme
MGFGVLGQDSAAKLKALGFNVIGWSKRSRKQVDGFETFDARRPRMPSSPRPTSSSACCR